MGTPRGHAERMALDFSDHRKVRSEACRFIMKFGNFYVEEGQEVEKEPH